MDVTVDPLADELDTLRRKYERERAARREAERIGERATAELFETVEQLRAVQAEMVERADRERVTNMLARELRRELESRRLLHRAVRAIGESTASDRCQIHLLGRDEHLGEEPADWVRPGFSAPPPVHLAAYPVELQAMAADGLTAREGLWIPDVLAESTLPPGTGEFVLATLGGRSGAGVPMVVGGMVLGWISLVREQPGAWGERERSILCAVAGDLATCLLQVLAFERQRESMRRLEELDEAKSEFISTVSHELRTPLTSISGYVEMITDGEMGPLSTSQERTLGIIERNTQRLRSLVEDLLTLSAFDAKEAYLAHSALDLRDVVARSAETMTPLVRGRDLRLDLDLPAGTWWTAGDEGQLERVVTNLLSNAIKFTPDGGRVGVTGRVEADAVVLVVDDTGVGIPEDEQDQLFTRFFRSSFSRAAEVQGTGLGLVVVKTIVEEHGGTIDLASAAGEGTTVTLRLPRHAPPDSATSGSG